MIVDDKIKVLIVGSSQAARAFIAHIVNSDPGMQVMGMARNGCEALRFLSGRRPDAILMDIEMPGMDGLEATRRIMETRPVPIILCKGRMARSDLTDTAQLLETGAVACIEVPRGEFGTGPGASAAQLLQTVRLMSEIKLVRRWPHARRVASSGLREPVTFPMPRSAQVSFIGIGASTGGPPVLKTILEGLPQGFSVPLLVVQHIATGFLTGLAEWLNQGTGVEVRVARHGILPEPGHAYLAPDDFHMELAVDGTIALVEGGLDNGVRPSVSHLFQSLAGVCGPSAVGVLLTGMGKDGAQALKQMRERGSTTIAQDRESSVVHGMPGEAIAIGAVNCVLPAGQIAPALIALVNQQGRAEGGLSWLHYKNVPSVQSPC